MPTETFFNLPEDKRNKIVEIALEEFAANDYQNASVTNIVNRAGISKGSLYQYFENKKDLYTYLFKIAAQAKIELITQRTDINWEDFFAAYYNMLMAGAEFSLTYPLESEVLAKVMESPFKDELWGAGKKMSEDFLEILVQGAQGNGQVRSDISAELIAFCLNAITTEFGKFLASQAGIEPNVRSLVDNFDKLRELDLAQITGELVELLQNGTASNQTEQ